MTNQNQLLILLTALLLSIGGAVTVSGQDVNLNLIFPSDPPANPFTWDGEPGLIMLDIDNNEDNQWNVTMFVEIADEGGEVMAVSSPTEAQSIIMEPFSSTTVEGTNVAVIGNLDYLNPDIVANQMFPPGNYNFCLNVQFDNIGFPFSFSQMVCQPFSIQGGVIDISTSFNLGSPSSIFADWDLDAGLINVDIQNNGDPVEVFLVGFLNGEFGAMANTNPANAPHLNLVPGVNSFNGPNSLPVSAMDIFDPGLQNTGILAAGDYDLCIDVVNAADEQVIEGPICQMFTIEAEAPDVTGDLTINPPISNEILNWDGLSGQFTLDLTNNSTQNGDVFVVATLFDEGGGTIAQSSIARSVPVIVPPGNSTWNGPNSFPVSTMDIVDQDVMNTGLLPAGDYDLCIDLVWAEDETLLDQLACQSFTIEAEPIDIVAVLDINSSVPANMNTWDAMAGLFTLSIESAGITEFDVLLDMKLNGLAGGDLFADLNAGIIPSLNITQGTNNFSGPQAFPSSAMTFYPPINDDQILPAGDYEICIDVINVADLEVLQSNVCATFTIEAEPIDIVANLDINAEVPANMNTWDAMAGLFTLSIESVNITEFDVLLDMRCFGLAGGELFADLNAGIIPSLNITQGTNNFSGPQAFPSSAMTFYPPINVDQTLPPWDYEICIDIINAADLEVLETNVCATFTIDPLSINIGARVFTNTQVSPNLDAWDIETPYIVEFTNNDAVSYDINIKTTVSGQNGVVSETNDALKIDVSINPGVTPFNAEVISPFANMDVLDAEVMLNDNTLPPGDYDICIDVFSASDGELLLDAICDQFTIDRDPTGVDPDLSCPMLISPTDGAEISRDDLNNTVFHWLPTGNVDADQYGYRFTLVEVLEGQSVGEAMANNAPLIEREISADENVLILNDDELPPGYIKKYGWGVTLLDILLGNEEVLCNPDNYTIGITGVTDTPFWPDTSIVDSIPNEEIIPPPTVPPETVPKKCNSIQVSVESGTSPSLGVVLEEPEKFKYPRAVALRAEGIDWDLDRFFCGGCEGTASLKEVAVRDLVDDFEWTLEGKGQLNSPYDLESIKSLQDRLAEIEKRLRAIEDELNQIQEDTAKNIPDEIKAMEAKVASLTEKEVEKKAECDSLDADLEKTKTEINQKEQGIGEYNTQLETSWENYTQLGVDIDTLERFLDGEPGSNERAQQDVIAGIKEALDQLKVDLQEKEDEIDDRSTELQQEIQDAEVALLDAVTAYNAQKGAMSGLSETIRSLESAQLADPDIRKFILRKREWSRKTTTFISMYETSSSRQESLFAALLALNHRLMLYASKNSLARDSIDTDLLLDLSTFTSGLSATCSSLTGDARTNCYTALGVIATAKSSLSVEILNLLSTDAKFDLAIAQQIDNLRGQISAMQGSLSSLESASHAREEEYKTAVLNFSSEILSLEEERNDLADEVLTKEDELIVEEEKLAEMRQIRLDDLDQNYQTYVERLKSMRENEGKAFGDWQEARDSISSYQSDTLHLNSKKVLLKEASDKCKEQLKVLQDVMEIAKNKLAALQKSLIEMRKKAKELKEEQSDLEKERDELKKELETKLGEGDKTASGPLVYYIPPPLEEILQNEEKFDSLKNNVAKAEAELTAAYAEKEGLPGKIVGQMEFAAYELVKLKRAKDQVLPMETAISTASDQLKEDKTHAHQEVVDEYSGLVDNVEKAEKKIDTIKIRIQGLVQDSIRLVSEIADLKASIAQEVQDINTKKELLDEKISQREYEEGLLKNAEGTHNSKTEDLRKLKSDLEVKRNELGRAQVEMSNASVQENDVAFNAAKSKAEGLKDEIRVLEETTIPAKEGEVTSISTSLESAKNRVVAARQQADAALKAWNTAVEHLDHDTRDKLIQTNAELKKVSAALEYWRRQLMIAQGKLDQRKKEVSDKKDKTDDMVNNQDDIKAKQASIDAMKEQLKALRNQEKKSKNEVEDAVAKKKEWIKEADKKILDAKEKLKKAEEDLHVYLRDEEFEVVDHKVMITLKARDQGVDGWRTSEGEVELTKELKYPKKRVPEFKNKLAISNKPPEIVRNSICFPSVGFIPPGPFEEVLTDIGEEPRTIALMYKKGKPLWLEWPVIPADAPLLSMDVIKLHSIFTTDNDIVIYACASSDPDCPPSLPIKAPIVDLHTYQWDVEGKIISEHPYLYGAWWEPDIVVKPKPEKNQIIDVTGMANEIAGDQPKVNHDEPLVKPGVMIECTDSIKGKPDTAIQVQSRVVRGDHKPLEGEDIEFVVKLVKGASEGFGFGGGETKKRVQTDGDGYAKVDFEFGDGYAEYEFTATWYRGSTEMEVEKFKGIAPLNLKFHKLGNGPPDIAWVAIEGLFGGGSVESAVNALPDTKEDENADKYNRQMHAIAGLTDGYNGFANGQKLNFESNKKEIELDPKQDETRIIGIGRTKINGVPEDKDKEFKFDITVKVDSLYKDIAKPAEVKKSYSTKGIKEFYIGSSELPFLVETDEEFNPEEIFSGSCHLKTDINMLGLSDLVPKEYILDPLKEITLTATGIKVEASGGDKYTASQGKVTWRGADGLEFTALNFTCRMDSFSVTATLGAEIGGTMKQATYFPDPIGYSATIEPTGDFLGKLTNLPEISAAGFKVKKGSAFSVDMHDGISPGTLEKSFKGVLIHTAQMELPDVLSRRSEDDKPNELAVKDFYIGTSIRQGGSGSVAFGGEVSYTGTLFEIGYAGYNLSAQDITLVFENNALTEGKISGEIDLPLPMAGKLQLEISKAGDTWSAKPETKEPITIPRLGTTFTLKDGTGITWDEAKKIGTLRLNAMAVSKDYGEIRIDGFEINSEGLVKAENISIEQSIEFSGGFKMNLESLSFLREADGKEYRLELNGGLAFPTIGIEDITGKLILSPGPSLGVEIADATIEFDKDPVEFKGKFSFSGREFKGQFDIGIKKVIPNGLSGLLIIGNTEDAANTTYNYWYAELKAGVIIPLGQTGTAILEIGGGVGHNYNPPVGNTPGSPTNTDQFSFKAIVGAGNYPGNGNLFAGRLEMVLAAPVFTMYGKVWILDSEENIYGDGTLNLNWETPSVSGDLGMFIGLADADADIFMFKGKIIFMYSPTQTFIRSEEISGSVLKKIKGEGHFDITKEYVTMGGSLSYSFDDGYGFAGILKALIDIDVAANGDFRYDVTPQRVRIRDTYFRGSCDIDLETPFGDADILSGAFGLELDLLADPNTVEVSGSGFFEYDVFIYSGRSDFEVGYKSP